MTVYFIASMQDVALNLTPDRVIAGKRGITWDDVVALSIQPLIADFAMGDHGEGFSHPDEVDWDTYGNELVSWAVDNIRDTITVDLGQRHREWSEEDDTFMDHIAQLQYGVTFGLIDNLKRMLLEYLPSRGLPVVIEFKRMVGLNPVMALTFQDSTGDQASYTNPLYTSVSRLARSLRLSNL